MSNPPTFEHQLRAELVTAASRDLRRRRRGTIAIGTAVAALVSAAVGVFILDPSVANADVKITREDGRVQVLLTDLHNSADDVQRALDREGIDVRVEALPSGPSNVGRFVGDEGTGSGVQNLETIGDDGPAFIGFSVPEDWDGNLTVYFGRPAKPGEDYIAFSDAYAAGEPLACSATIGRPLKDAAALLKDYEVDIRSGPGTPSVSLEAALEGDQASHALVSAIALSGTHLIVDVSAEPVTPANPGC